MLIRINACLPWQVRQRFYTKTLKEFLQAALALLQSKEEGCFPYVEVGDWDGHGDVRMPNWAKCFRFRMK